MINIISRSIISRHTRGPRKVVLNTIKGLDLLGYPYIVNAAPDSTNQLWIHDDPSALKETVNLGPEVKIIAGPNIHTIPTELPKNLPNNITWLHPALWVQDFWNTFGGNHLKSVVWPAGIDTTKFIPSQNTKDKVLVYNKQRSDSDVETVCKALQDLRQDYEVITYGKYQEDEYIELLQHSKAIIWVGRSESQGIGLMEALAMNVPILVVDVTRFGQWSGDGHDRFTTEQLNYFPVTVAPYFNENCGLIAKDIKDIHPLLDKFLCNLEMFSPREFVENNFRLEKQALALLSIFKNEYGVSEDELKNTNLNNSRKWINSSISFKIKTNIKDAVRAFLR